MGEKKKIRRKKKKKEEEKICSLAHRKVPSIFHGSAACKTYSAHCRRGKGRGQPWQDSWDWTGTGPLRQDSITGKSGQES
jgi:hypothetical protein